MADGKTRAGGLTGEGRLIPLLTQFFELDGQSSIQAELPSECGSHIDMRGARSVPIHFLEEQQVRWIPLQLRADRFYASAAVVDIPSNEPKRP